MAFPLVPQTTLFADEGVAALLTAVYPLATTPKVNFYKHGINDIYRVAVGDAVYYWRLGKADGRSGRAVAAELALVQAVCAAGVPVALPVRQRNGRFYHTIAAPEGERTAVLFHEAPGAAPRQLTPHLSRQLGRHLAVIHQVGDQLGSLPDRPPLDETFLLDAPLQSATAEFGQHALLDEAAARVKATLAANPAAQADYGPCHGDLNEVNFHLADQGQMTLFDFDFCGDGWRAYDLAVFNWSLWLVGYEAAARTAVWEAFLAGYGEKRPLAPATLALIPAFTLARQIWIIGLHTGPATWHYGRRWLNAKYRQKHFGLLQQLRI